MRQKFKTVTASGLWAQGDKVFAGVADNPL